MCLASTGPTKSGTGMLRLADDKRNQGLTGLMGRQQLVQPDEGRAFADRSFHRPAAHGMKRS